MIEKRRVPVAEVRPVTGQSPTARLPDREKFVRSLGRVKTDSGRMLEHDRT